MAALDEAASLLEDHEGTLAHLKKRLTRAKVLYDRGDRGEALGLVADLSAHSLVTDAPLLRLLVVDLEHRLLRRTAMEKEGEERAAALEQAYRPYLDLLNADALNDNLRRAFEDYIYSRWAAHFDPDETKRKNTPSIVLYGIASVAVKEGKRKAIEAHKAQRKGNSELHDKRREQAQPKLERARRLYETLLKRDGLPTEVEAQATAELAASYYWLEPNDPEQNLKAAKQFLTVAEKFPERSATEQALGNAVNGILRGMMQRRGRFGAELATAVDEAYRRGVKLLFEHFPESEPAHNERVYYAVNLLIPEEDWARAAEVLRGMPREHPDYFTAQRGVLEAMQQRLASLQEKEKAQTLRYRARDQAERLEQQAQDRLADVQRRERRIAIEKAAAKARLVRAELAMRAGETGPALALLENFGQRYDGHPALLREALSTRILALVDDGQYERAGKQARQTMQRFEGDAELARQAATVIDQVVTELDTRIERLRREAATGLVAAKQREKQARARKLASAAKDLANVLLDWASAQDFEATEEQLAGFREQHRIGDDVPREAVRKAYRASRMRPYKVIFAKTLRLSGDPGQAINLLEGMKPDLEAVTPTTQFIENLAAAYFTKGTKAGEDAEALKKAADQYNRLINGLRSDEEGNYPELYWEAWCKTLTVNDKLGQHTDVIPNRVRQLEQRNENLGGEPHKSCLQQLKRKYR
jgi:hypothetical protein